MGNLILELQPDSDNPEVTQKAYVYDASGVCIGSVCRKLLGKPNKLCFNFREEYVISRETLLTPERICINEQQLNQ